MNALIRFIYAGVLSLLLIPASILKIRKNGIASLRLGERFGNINLPIKQYGIWVNFASVGEFKAVSNLLTQLKAENHDLFLTHSAEAVRSFAKEQLAVPIQLFPLDYQWVMQRMLLALKPKLIILVEQEIWANLILVATKQKIPVIVINGRMSARSARRHIIFGKLSKEIFNNISLICARDEEDAARFKELGASNVEITGNMKFDNLPVQEQIAVGIELKQKIQVNRNKPVLLIASTRASKSGLAEEVVLLDLLKDDLDNFNLILVPRHIERTAEVSNYLTARNIKYTLHSKLNNNIDNLSCILGDTIGHLDTYIAAADVVFIGASIINAGGQNPMEAFIQGKAVITGPNMQNFSSLINHAIKDNAVILAKNNEEIKINMLNLLANEEQRITLCENALRLAKSYGGATTATWKLLDRYLSNPK